MKFGRIDVDEFIDSIPADTLRKWRIFAQAEGWDSQWAHTAEILSWINSTGNAVQNSILAAGGIKPPKTKLLTGDDLRRMWRGKPIRKQEHETTVDQLKRDRQRGGYGY